MLESRPKALKYARIVAALATSRLIGLLLLTAPTTSIPSWYSITFGIGDVLTGIFAIPVAWALGRGGVRIYALAATWAALGFLDLVYAVAISTQVPGLYAGVSNFFGVGIIILPIAMVIQLVVLILLLTPPVAKYMGRSRTP